MLSAVDAEEFTHLIYFLWPPLKTVLSISRFFGLYAILLIKKHFNVPACKDKQP